MKQPAQIQVPQLISLEANNFRNFKGGALIRAGRLENLKNERGTLIRDLSVPSKSRILKRIRR